MRRIFIFAAIIAASITVPSQTAEEMARARQAEQDAVKAYRAKSYGDFLANMQLANSARPGHSRLIYNLAVAHALNDQASLALDSLERLADMGLYFDVARAEDLKALKANDRFKAVAARFDANKKPVSNSTRAFAAGDKSLITDGVAYDPRTKVFYLGGVHGRKIISIGAGGTVRDFSAETDGLWSVLGMRVDTARGWLWVCSAAFPQMRGYNANEKGRSGIFKYDLRSGKLLKKYILQDGEHALGDILIARDGTAYTTDSIAPVLFRIDPKRDELEEFVRSDRFVSLQGLTFGTRENEIYIADYAKGIFRVDLSSKNVVQLRPAASVTVLGIDGLYFYAGTLIGIQNGTNPSRVASFSLSGDSIIAHTTLEANNPDFMEPTLGTVYGDDLYYVANSQWPLVNEKAELTVEKLNTPVVLRMDLKKTIGR